MKKMEADEAGPSSSSIFTCEQCGKICKSYRGLSQHMQTHSSDTKSKKRRGAVKSQVEYKKKGKTKQTRENPAHKVTVVVENVCEEDGTESLPSPEVQKKVTFMREIFDVEGASAAENVSSVDVLYCDAAEDISDFSYPSNVDAINIADCSLIEDYADVNESMTEDNPDESIISIQENLIKDVVQEVVTEPDKEEEDQIIFLIDESGEVVMEDIEDFDFDFMLLPEKEQEEEWSEDPFPDVSGTFFSDLTPFEELLLNIQSAIPDGWIVDSSRKSIRLSLLSPFENVSVQRSIIWTGKKIKIFINNKLLPEDNFVWHSVAGIDSEDFSSVSDYLPKLCCLVQSSLICKGVRLYHEYWDKVSNEGFIENECYQDIACLRDKSCPLLVGGTGICVSCKKLSNVLKCKSFRAHHSKEEKDKKKINVRFLTGEEAKARLKETQEEKRKLAKQLFKMREKLRKYIEKHTVPVSAEFGYDIAKIFKDNVNIMTPVQKLFWYEQLKCLAKQENPRQMRYNPFIIRLALHLQMLSSTAYGFLQNFLNLPSQRTLYDYTHYAEAKEGLQEPILERLAKNCSEQCKKEDEKYFNVIFDEVDIRSGIVISRKTGEVVGYVQLSEVEKELELLEAEIAEKEEPRRQVAKKLLVYLAVGITNSLQGVVGVYTTGGNFTAGQVYTRTWNIIYRMESQGMKVLCLTCDGASVNKKFFKMHTNLDPTSKFIYKTHNMACGEDRPLFFITDPVHIVKSLRNNFSNSHSHKKTREMWKNGESISWAVIENLFHLTKGQNSLDLKLTKAHVKLTSHSCMKVIFAVQVMSLSVAKAIEYYTEELESQKLCVNEVQIFIKLVNDWFDCLNATSDPKSKRIKQNDNLLPYTDINDPRFTFLTETVLKFFDDWQKDVTNRPGGFKKEHREKMFISMLTYESIHTTTHSFIGVVKFLLAKGASEVNARRLNQDKVEQLFGKLRQAFGGNTNPGSSSAVQKIFEMDLVQGMAMPPSKGNTQVEKEEWHPDESPLQKRARLE
ncbi:Transposable element P transposase [Frankliniella fusca]|uniref:Transposable element P transposase n=1 Tax=Frankliniella fusca TaxID=407009 RepID=A0AAE1HBL6_9NEOP|nr:Transposable element P transposase [Frankliniella fusca]KAK3918402.1 Transposable element P transposase [Frankliniella fusca]